MADIPSALGQVKLLHSRFLKCCACCGCCGGEPGLVEADNCLWCNTAALRAMLPHLDDKDIAHISFKNKLMEVRRANVQ